jgi:hypothetical protein
MQTAVSLPIVLGFFTLFFAVLWVAKPSRRPQTLKGWAITIVVFCGSLAVYNLIVGRH